MWTARRLAAEATHGVQLVGFERFAREPPPTPIRQSSTDSSSPASYRYTYIVKVEKHTQHTPAIKQRLGLA